MASLILLSYIHMLISGISIIDQAVHKLVGYGVPFSTSNFLIPALDLRKKQIHAFCDFKTVQFLGGHDLVAKAVYNQQVALGAGHDGVIIDLSKQRKVSKTRNRNLNSFCGRHLFPAIR